MDISVSSNFERLLFDLYDRDGAAVAQLMKDFESGDITFTDNAMNKLRALFSSECVDDSQTCEQIADTWARSTYLLDPHSAIGVRAAAQATLAPDVPVISLATAHPAKFSDAVRQAGISQTVELPSHLQDLFQREERFTVLPNELSAVQAFISSNINA